MTDQKLIKLEKEIQNKIKVPETSSTHKKIAIDVAKLKKLAKKINEFEARSSAAHQH